MAIPVRINEDNYVSLQDEASANRRSIVAQLNHILDQHFNHSTVGKTDMRVINKAIDLGEAIEAHHAQLKPDTRLQKAADKWDGNVGPIRVDATSPQTKSITQPIQKDTKDYSLCKHNAVKGFCKEGCK